jgi:hypothetical protein
MSKLEMSDRLAAVLGPMMDELMQSGFKKTEEAAKADPVRYKKSRVYPAGVSTNYHWIPAGRDGKGREVFFCWSVHRNVAGYFLGWRQVYYRDRDKTVKRDRWLSSRKRRVVEAAARRRAEAFQQKQAERALPEMEDRKRER